MSKSFDKEQGKQFISKIFEESVVKSLCEFIEIPNLSRDFDEKYATNGLLEKAANHIKGWVDGLGLKGLKTQIIQHEGYTPLLFTEIEGDLKETTIFFYGHFDKQPHMTGWHEGKSATKPVIENGRLYGRGGADDGYSTYSSMLAVRAIQEQGLPLPSIYYSTQES